MSNSILSTAAYEQFLADKAVVAPLRGYAGEAETPTLFDCVEQGAVA